MPKKNIKIAIITVIALIVMATIFIFVILPTKKSNNSSNSSNATATKTTKNISDQDQIFSTLDFDATGRSYDMLNDPTGPYYHQIVRAISVDGLDFQKTGGVLIDKASVPDVIRLDSGRLLLYAADGVMDRSRNSLLVAYSDDDGASWTAGSLHVSNERTRFSVGTDPDIVLLDDGSFRLFYLYRELPASGQFDPNATCQVLSAVSTDGLNFIEEPGVRFEYTNITDPDVVKIGNTWYMYTSQGPRLIAASSTDGLTFTYEKIVREQGSVSSTIVMDDNSYRQFFCRDGIRSAISTDGLNWQENEGLRLTADDGEFICDPSPVQLDNGWIMIYKTTPL